MDGTKPMVSFLLLFTYTNVALLDFEMKRKNESPIWDHFSKDSSTDTASSYCF